MELCYLHYILFSLWYPPPYFSWGSPFPLFTTGGILMKRIASLERTGTIFLKMLLAGKGFSGHSAKPSLQPSKEGLALKEEKKNLTKYPNTKKHTNILHFGDFHVPFFSLWMRHDIVFRIGIFLCLKHWTKLPSSESRDEELCSDKLWHWRMSPSSSSALLFW